MKQILSLVLLALMVIVITAFGEGNILIAGVPTNGLVAYYPFNGNTNDESGKGKHLTNNGASLTVDRFGHPNSAYNFDGNDYMEINNFNFESDEITCCAWAQLSSVARYSVILEGSSNQFVLGNGPISNPDVWATQIHESIVVYGDHRPVVGELIFILATYSKSTGIANFYMGYDGSLFIKSKQAASYTISASVLDVGRDWGSSCCAFGTIDDICIYNRVLSDSEIRQLFSYPRPLARIDVTPSEVSLQAGIQQQFTATGYDNHGNPMTINPTWTASGGTISNSGLFTATMVGDYQVIATEEDKADTAIVHLIPGELTAIEVTPASADLKAGQQQQYTAKGYDAYHNEVAVTAQWAATGGTITPTGLYSAEKAGYQTVLVSVSGSTVNGTATVVVTPGALARISVMPDKVNLNPGMQQQFAANGYDAFNNNVTINPTWSTTGGQIDATGLFTAEKTGDYTITVSVSESSVTGTATVQVTPGALTRISVMPDKVNLNIGMQQQFAAKGYDAFNNIVNINPTWSTTGGEISRGGRYTATFVGDFMVTASVSGSSANGTASVHVTGGLVVFYPFTGNTEDSSGNGNHGTNHGATLAADRFGKIARAYSFNGNGNYIAGGNGSSLQISQDITVCLWAKIQPTTHGQVLVNKYLRTSDRGWLVETRADGSVCFNVRSGAGELNTSGGDFNVFDNKWHFIVGQRHQDTLKIYVDGLLRSQNKTNSAGDMSCEVDLMIGVQSDRPTDPAAFCNGVIDDIRIYSYVIPEVGIQKLYSDRLIDTGVEEQGEPVMHFELSQNYPNPFNPSTSIKFEIQQASHVKFAIYNMLGEEVRLLLDEEKSSGMYEIQWDGKNKQGLTLPSGVYFYSLSAGNFKEIRKMILAK